MADAYVVDKQIGKGAFGIAYTCTHKVDQTVCVLKKVRLTKQKPKERQATLRELLILSSVKHRNILEFKDCWVSEL